MNSGYLNSILEQMPESARKKWEDYKKLSPEERVKRDIETYNSETVENTDGGINCDICHNKRLISYLDDNGQQSFKNCICVRQRALYTQMKQSGAANPDTYTLEKYKANTDWQKHIKQKAVDFLESDNKAWFFIGGQVGAGKTHICTAILLKLLSDGKRCKYMSWTQEVARLNTLVNDINYGQAIKEFKEPEVLYIDDLFKHRKGEQPTSGEINRAFEILQYRYNNGLATIISSEKTISELIEIDEATGSRISERAGKQFTINIKSDPQKNYRLKP